MREVIEDLLKWQDGSCFCPLDDGHTPEGLSKGEECYVKYSSEAAPTVHVTDEAVSPGVCRAWYETMTTADNPAWGTYVTLDEIYENWRKNVALSPSCSSSTTTTTTTQSSSSSSSSSLLESHRHALAVEVASVLVRQAWELQESQTDRALTTPPAISYTLGKDGTSVCETRHQHNRNARHTIPTMPLWWRERNAHGVAVWALASQQGAAVPYHVDYAEQVRYSRGILSCPLWGGVLHCSPGTMTGGDYYVYLKPPVESMAHYQKHGYKAQRQELDLSKSVRIAYRTNRLISQAGYLSHGSTAVTHMSKETRHRVVVGLNVFGADVASVVQRWPEHSPQFNAWVKSLRQARSEKDARVSLHTLVKNHPRVARQWLKRQRQIAFQKAAQQLEADVETLLVKSHTADGVCISQIQTACANPKDDGAYPSPTDVLVFVEQQCRQGKLRILKGNLDGNDAMIGLVPM